MHRAQGLRGHDGIGGVEVKHRHDEGHGNHKHPQPALELVGRAFFGFDEFLGLAQGFSADGDVGFMRDVGVFLGHGVDFVRE